MTNITGKIYQQTNDDGTENRFPKTVVPAVIGLSQYLQDQFNTLSDLYMPKEGESESKTGQEITYRKSEATINAKTVTINRIYGKTLVWNQLIVEKSAGTTTTNGVTVVGDGHGCYTISTDSGGATADYNLTFTPTWIQGHKYLLAGCPPGGSSSTYCFDTGWFGVETGSGKIVNNTRNDVSYWPRILVKSGTVITTPIKFCPIFIDLTLMFGSGKEPSAVAEFYALYPGYHNYNIGKLINNGIRTSYSLYWNQLTKAITGVVSFSRINDYTSSYSFSESGQFYRIPFDSFTTVSGHKYLWAYQDTGGNLRNSTSGDIKYRDSSTWSSGNVEIFTGTGVLSGISLTNDSKASGNGTVKCSIYDLTLMFGEGNEPTINEFLSLFPRYSDYNVGEQKEFYFPQFETKLKTVGFNQWDEKLVSGRIRFGVDNDNSQFWRTPGYIPCLSSTTYYYKIFNGDSRRLWLDVFYYDANKNYISGLDAVIAGGYNGSAHAVTPANACYVRFCVWNQDFGSGVGETPQLCMNISDESKNGTYEPYRQSLLSLNLTNLRAKSPNIWDEEWVTKEKYADDSITPISESGRIRTKNPIPAQPSTTYYAKVGGNGYIYPKCMDVNGNYLGTSSPSEIKNQTFTTLPGTAFIVFHTYNYGNTYNNDICINLSNPGHDGNYYPYGSFNPFPEGLRSVDTAFDEIIGNKVIRKIKRYNLYDASWSIDGADFWYTSSIPTNLNRYTCKTPRTYFDDGSKTNPIRGCFYRSGGGYFEVYLPSISSSNDVKAELAGDFIYVKLATPEEFTLETPLNLMMPAGTIERRLPENTVSSVSAPFCCDLTYNASETAGVLDALQGLSRKLELIEERLARLEDN